jgi:phosphopantetheine--protein transferase-like protein
VLGTSFHLLRVLLLINRVDTELISAVPTSATFRERNFTSDEIKYCTSAPDPTASFAGRWAAKEAVVRLPPSYKTIADK